MKQVILNGVIKDENHWLECLLKLKNLIQVVYINLLYILYMIL